VGGNVVFRDGGKGVRLGIKIVWIDGEGRGKSGWKRVWTGHFTIGVAGREILYAVEVHEFLLEGFSVSRGRRLDSNLEGEKHCVGCRAPM
jgi:hypothetical protein